MSRFSDLSRRQAGVLAHVTALPGAFGVGEIGANARRFVDYLAELGAGVWQVLPLNPTHGDASPYSAVSSFAGNEQLLSIEAFLEPGWLSQADLEPLRGGDALRIDFPQVRALRARVLAKAADRALADGLAQDADYRDFVDNAGPVWLDDYALYAAIGAEQGGLDWVQWPQGLRNRTPDALEAARDRLAPAIARVNALQYLFERQWADLRAYAHAQGLAIFGDAPIYVAMASADVWAHRALFDLTPEGVPLAVAGCPPDAFGPEGQHWGNPLYDWAAMAREDYAWWIARIRRLVVTVDIARLDHFRAFAQYWAIPGGAAAPDGAWRDGPGAAVFEAIRSAIGDLPLVAEDLGLITPDVYALRDQLDLPGMIILQSELHDGALVGDRSVANHRARAVVYTGSHDNTTAQGWFDQGGMTPQPPEPADGCRAALLKSVASETDPSRAFVTLAARSGANLAIVQMQDLLGLGDAARFNVPGAVKPENWSWRFSWDQIEPARTAHARAAFADAGRSPPEGAP
ncbi:MAG: 4-alpha-glucanotransferase [Maricaulaceae bacterium]